MVETRRPLKIGYVWQYEAAGLPPVSATALHIQAVVQAFQRRGHQVRLLAVREGVPQVTEDLNTWTPVSVPALPGAFDLAEKGLRWVQGRLGLPYLRFFASYRFSRACQAAFASFDVLYERFWFNGYGGLLAARRLGIPLVYEVNGDLPAEYEQLGIRLTRFQWAAIHRITRWMFTRAARLVTVSEPLRRRTVERWGLPPDQVAVVPNGARMDLFAGERPGGEDGLAGPLKGHPAVIFVGSFKPWHGLDLLVQAFASLASSRPEARLVFVGDGPKREDLQAQVSSLGLAQQVIFTGAVPQAEVADLLSAAQVAVVNPRVSPASQSQSPLKLFEYMAAGKAIVAPLTPNLDAILEHGRTAILVPPDDPEALAAALSELLEDADLRSRLGSAARQQALERHSWDAAAEKLEKIFFAHTRHPLYPNQELRSSPLG